MNRPDFEEWMGQYLALFPSTKIWLDGLENKGAAQRELWFGLLRNVPYIDVLEATKRMASGEQPAVGPFHHDREQTGRLVRDNAKRIQSEREAADQRAAQVQQHSAPRSRGEPLVGAFNRLQALREQGVSWADAVDRVFPPVDEESEPHWLRFKCPICQDHGIVSVVSSTHVFQYLRDELKDDGWLNRMAVPCECEAGVKYLQLEEGVIAKGKWHHTAKYSTRSYCKLPETGDVASDVQAFRQWCEWRFSGVRQ